MLNHASMKEYHHKHVEWIDDECIITIHWSTWFGFGKPNIERYRGSSRVYRNLTSGKRCPTYIERDLAEIYTIAKWEKDKQK
jgi:hypothetical protein